MYSRKDKTGYSIMQLLDRDKSKAIIVLGTSKVQIIRIRTRSKQPPSPNNNTGAIIYFIAFLVRASA